MTIHYPQGARAQALSADDRFKNVMTRAQLGCA